MKRLSTLLGSLLTAALIATPAGSQPTGDIVEAGISSANLEAGGTATVFGRGWLAESEVTILFDGQRVGATTVGDEGRFSREVAVPGGAEAGEAELTVEGTDAGGEPASYSIPVTISGDGTPRGAWVWVGVTAAVVAGVLLVAGLLLLWRRRRASVAELERSGLDPVPDPDPRKQESPGRARGS